MILVTLNMKACACLFLLYLCNLASSNPIIIETKNGKVSGVSQTSFSGKEYFAFLGIPFAESPTDELRFMVLSGNELIKTKISSFPFLATSFQKALGRSKEWFNRGAAMFASKKISYLGAEKDRILKVFAGGSIRRASCFGV